MTTIAFVLLYYKETKEEMAAKYLKLKEEMDILIKEKQVLESKLEEQLKT